MYTLDEQQVDYILNDIKVRGVEMEDLQLNLLDHICCLIESELEPGDDFEALYRKTIPKFFKKELREIEEETIFLLTFKHYYAMKKTMITTGTVSVISFIAGSILKIMHLPGASILLFLGIAIASLVFLPLIFILKTRETNSMRDKVVLGIGTFFGILISLATLFKVMHWPYANMMWLTSIGILFFLFIPIYFFSGIRNPETKLNTITSSILVIVAGGLLFTLTSLKPSLRVTKEYMYAYVQNEELLKKMQNNMGDSVAANQLAAQINSNCNKIKELIIQDEIGMTFIPDDFEAQNIFITEGHLGDEFSDNGIGAKLFSDLKTAVDNYNSSKSVNEEKIPIDHSILEFDPSKMSMYNNFFVLNSIVQVQMYLASSEK